MSLFCNGDYTTDTKSSKTGRFEEREPRDVDILLPRIFVLYGQSFKLLAYLARICFGLLTSRMPLSMRQLIIDLIGLVGGHNMHEF